MNNLKSSRKIYVIIFCVILLCLMAAQCIPMTMVGREERESALRGQCGERLHKISKICLQYANSHNGAFPSDSLQTKGVSEILEDEGFLKDRSDLLCPSTKTYFPRASFCFIPGVRTSMSPKMPCVIEKITNHDRLIGVVYVDGSTAQIRHECQNYSSLLPLFTGITPEERRLLEVHLKRLDIP